MSAGQVSVSPPAAVLCHAELGVWDCSWTGKPCAVDTHWQLWPRGCGEGNGGVGRQGFHPRDCGY